MEAWREELYHHGVKGQKWGVRRYQDLDGSLTALGKRHIKLNPSYKGSVVSVDNGPSKSSGGGGGRNLEDKDFSKLDEELAGILGRNPNYVLESGDEWLAELGEMGYDVDSMSEEEIISLFEHAKEWLSANRQSEPQEEQSTEEESKAKKSGGKSKGSSGKGSSKGSSKSSAAEQKTAKAVESGSERKDIDAARDRASDSFWRQYGISSEAFKRMSADEQKRYLQAARKKKDKYMRELGFSHSDYTGWSIKGGVLVHHGIKGQKWGIRRYQNEDGTYTAAGKKRYLSGSGEFTSSGKRKYGRDLTKELNRLEQEYAYSVGKQNKAKYDATKQLGKLKKHADNLEKELEKHPERASDDGPSFKKAKDKAIKIANKYNDAARRNEEAISEIQKGEKETWKLLARAAETGMTVKSRVVGRYTYRGEEILARHMALYVGPASIPVMLARAKIKERKGTPVAVNTNKWKVKPSKDGQAHIQAPAAGLQPEDPDKKKRN